MFPPPSSLLAPPSFASLTRETACSTGGDGGKDIVSRIEMDATKPNYRGAAKDGSFAANPSPPLSKRPPLNFAQNFLLLLLLLFVYTYIHVYVYVCVCVFFLFFFFIPVMPTKTEIRWYRKFAFRTSPRRHLIPNLCELPAPRVIAFASIHPPDELCERRLT